MVRGRMGGNGAAFNLGEVTVVRCSVALAGELGGGEVGHAYVQGRDAKQAEHCALLDALMHTDQKAQLLQDVIEPLQTQLAQRRETEARKAAATQVDFFTLARGED